MFCNNCGAQIPDNSSRCPNCGAMFYPPNQNQNQQYQYQYAQPFNQPPPPPYNMPPQHSSDISQADTLGIISIIIGILISPLIGLILGYVGRSNILPYKDISPQATSAYNKCKAGIIVGWVFIGLRVIGILLYAIFAMGLLASFAEYI